MAVTGCCRLWRRGVTVWLILVAVACGLTLWWQDSVEPQRHGWEQTGPTPSLPGGWESACAGVRLDENGQALCFVRTR